MRRLLILVPIAFVVGGFVLLFVPSSAAVVISPLVLFNTGHRGNFYFDTSYNWSATFTDNDGNGADASVQFQLLGSASGQLSGKIIGGTLNNANSVCSAAPTGGAWFPPFGSGVFCGGFDLSSSTKYVTAIWFRTDVGFSQWFVDGSGAEPSEYAWATFRVAPNITNIWPTFGIRSQTITDFTVNGVNFQPNAATLSFGGSGITVNSYSSRIATQIVASITMAADAAPVPGMWWSRIRRTRNKRFYRTGSLFSLRHRFPLPEAISSEAHLLLLWPQPI